MKMYCHFANVKLATPTKYDMENPVELEAVLVSVVVNMGARNRDVVTFEVGSLGKVAKKRLDDSFIHSS